MKHFLLFIMAAALLSACSSSEQPAEATTPEPASLTACDCVQHYKTKDQALIAACDDQRQDEAFDAEFKRCLGASILGRSPEDVNVYQEGQTQLSAPQEGVFSFVPERSRVTWTGRKLGGSHSGELTVKSGTVRFENENIVGGEITIDMTSLVNKDLKDPQERAKLEGHLKSDDFFGVDTYPEARFLVSSASIEEGKGDITGSLTVKGTTKKATIKNAVIGKSGKNEVLVGGVLIFDRTEFGVRYGSGKFFQNLGDAMIYDEVTLNVTLRAKLQEPI
jgi:polyisoprenoid-binding protein YceI